MTDQKKLLFQHDTSVGSIEICQNNNQRWLTIDTIEQSRIDIEHPDQLISPLHHYFLTALLFINQPKTVLLGGLGGGAIARYLHNKQPEIQGTAIEIDATIATISQDYFYFPKDQWNISITDLQAHKEGCYDFIIIDIAVNDLTPDWLTDTKMLQQLKQQLSKGGVLAINLLLTDAQSLIKVLESARKIFDRRTLCINVPDHKNIILFAFNQSPQYNSMMELNDRAKHLTRLWDIDFQVLLEQAQKDNPKGSGII